MSRRFDKTSRAFYLNSYAKAQQESAHPKSARIPLKPIHRYAQEKPAEFGSWRLPRRAIEASERLDVAVSQVHGKPLEHIPKVRFTDVPHIQAILWKSRALDSINAASPRGTGNNTIEHAIVSHSDRLSEKLQLLEKLHAEVLPKYRAYALLEFIRQEKTWLDALALCSKGIWEKSYKSEERMFAHQMENIEKPSEICISKCPKGDIDALRNCHKEITRHKIHVQTNTMLRGLVNAAQKPGQFWAIAMRMVARIPAVQNPSKVRPISGEQSKNKQQNRGETFALLLSNMGTKKKGTVVRIMNYIDDHFPEMACVSSIWAAYFRTRACRWEDCVRVYNTNFVHRQVNCDTNLFDSLIQRCVDARALEVAKTIHLAMRSRGVPESFAKESNSSSSETSTKEQERD